MSIVNVAWEPFLAVPEVITWSVNLLSCRDAPPYTSASRLVTLVYDVAVPKAIDVVERTIRAFCITSIL